MVGSRLPHARDCKAPFAPQKDAGPTFGTICSACTAMKMAIIANTSDTQPYQVTDRQIAAGSGAVTLRYISFRAVRHTDQPRRYKPVCPARFAGLRMENLP